MIIQNLSNTDFNTLFHAFECAFSDYEVHFDKEEVRSMLKRRGYTPELSFAAYHNGEIIAFTLNGTGRHNATYTAYDTGTGTQPPYRGQGIAKKIFTHSLPYLKEAGIKQYLLEVLQNNTKAISVYQDLGFGITRNFDCFRREKAKLNHHPIADYEPQIFIAPIALEDISRASAFCDFTSSWQSSIDSITRAGNDLTRLGAFISGKLVGYCVFDSATGDISQIAVHRQYRRKHIASKLFHEAVTQIAYPVVKVLNVDSADHTLATFLTAQGMVPSAKQFEMALPL